MLKRPKKKHSFSQIIVWIISVLVVLSMAVGFVISVLPPEAPPDVPVRSISTPAPRFTSPPVLVTPAS